MDTKEAIKILELYVTTSKVFYRVNSKSLTKGRMRFGKDVREAIEIIIKEVKEEK